MQIVAALLCLILGSRDHFTCVLGSLIGHKDMTGIDFFFLNQVFAPHLDLLEGLFADGVIPLGVFCIQRLYMPLRRIPFRLKFTLKFLIFLVDFRL